MGNRARRRTIIQRDLHGQTAFRLA
ncbi:GntR family transcriptional regulator, partial [Burkholderia multivorans]